MLNSFQPDFDPAVILGYSSAGMMTAAGGKSEPPGHEAPLV